MSAVRKFRVLVVAAVFLCSVSFFCILMSKILFSRTVTDPYDSLGFHTIVLDSSMEISPTPREQNCTYSSCFDVYRCSDKLTVYLYPLQRFLDQNGSLLSPLPSREFLELREWIRNSSYFQPDPAKACVFVPSVDTLNQNRLSVSATSRVLSSLLWWKGSGSNHLLFSMLPGSVPDYNETLDVGSGRAILAASAFSTVSYRRTFDISIPVWNPFLEDISDEESGRKRDQLLTFFQPFVHQSYIDFVSKLAQKHRRILVLHRWPGSEDPTVLCHQASKEHFQLPHTLLRSEFCLVVEGSRLGGWELGTALSAGCIPVLVSDSAVLPFSEVLDWKRASLRLYRHELADIIQILSTISEERRAELRSVGRFFWENYFRNMSQITVTTLRILEERMFPHRARGYQKWNEPTPESLMPKWILEPRVAPQDGFTAVVLTYDRVRPLFNLLRVLGKVRSLSKVVVVWNNPLKKPPASSQWPQIGKPIHVVRNKQNRLSNRFLPFDSIETECILSLDDDLAAALHPDELEFGYQVWREYPSHLVGFPPRVHVKDPVTGQLVYNSEWTNNISMILTGAAFFHKYFSHLYSTRLPPEVKQIVETKMNCEDVAMNFLIAKYTGNAVIKVSPKKKFRCSECSGAEATADPRHLEEKSDCVRRFAAIFGSDTLKTVEFRADPTLFKVPGIPEDAVPFPGLGSV